MKTWKAALGLGAACAACCAVPLIGGTAAFAAGSTAVAALGAALAVCVGELALMALGLAALIFGSVVFTRQRRRATLPDLQRLVAQERRCCSQLSFSLTHGRGVAWHH